jgi:alkylation response protein AidB-like acyl-CoA dehydrogenase
MKKRWATRLFGERAVFEDVFVSDDHVIGGLRNGWAINRAVLNYSRVPVAAIALGIARGALEAAEAFASSERLGNRRLIDYQEVQLAIST